MRYRGVRQKQMQKKRALTGGALLFSIISGVVSFLMVKRRRQRPPHFWQRIKSAA